MKNFFANLSQSARIALITCGCFVLLTMLILIFLMLCPIRESSAADKVNDALIVTTIQEDALSTAETETTAVSVPRKTTTTKRHTTTARTVTTETKTAANAYNDPNENDTQNAQNNSYQPAATTRSNRSNNTPTQQYTTPAPAQPATQAPAPVVTEAPVVTQAPEVPVETLPPQEEPAPEE